MIDEIVAPESPRSYSLSFKVRQKLKRSTRRLFASESHQLIICTHHKTGTNWFRKVFEDIAFDYGLDFSAGWSSGFQKSADILFDHHSHLKMPRQEFRGIHIIRDPRDIVVSGYHYHLWTEEKWAHESLEILEGKSYQERLNEVSKDEGLFMEIKRCHNLFERMQSWNYKDVRFLELKYEEVITNEQQKFEEIFRFFGVNDKALPRLMEIVDRHTFQKVTKRRLGESKSGEHLRSGQPGTWKNELSGEHITALNKLYPNLLSNLGYK